MFPNPVNEKATRVVAGGVALVTILILLTGWHWLVAVLAVGFLARLLTGPRLSVLAQLATRAIAPRLGPPVWVPGPPKRFAQGVGLVLTALAAAASLIFNARMLAILMLSVLLVFALTESVVGFCAGCWLFGLLMAHGFVSAETCMACNQVKARYRLEPQEVGPLMMPTDTWARPSKR